jgi:hypothetical protein
MTNYQSPLHSVAKNWFEFVDQFRLGEYDDASEAVQYSWHLFCDKILPTVAKKKLED